LYQQLWTEKGSPLIFYTEELKQKLQDLLGNSFEVFVGMRYGNPGYKNALSEIKKGDFEKLVLIPLYPQHAMSTTETSIVAAEKEIQKLGIKAEVITVEQFYNHPKFIGASVAQAKKLDLKTFDHIVFSYHGLPNRQVEKCHPGIKVDDCNCQNTFPEHGKYCYRATCYETSRLIASQLNLASSDYTVGFQSRLSNNWLTPFTDGVLDEKLKEGKKNILVFAPSFVTDCLETILEIGVEYGEEFEKMGGNKLQLVGSLNAEDHWVKALKEIITSKVNG
jgi:ferrochelatase